MWRARFWGHEPQTDIDLLEKGFHIVYCDVADLYDITPADIDGGGARRKSALKIVQGIAASRAVTN